MQTVYFNFYREGFFHRTIADAIGKRWRPAAEVIEITLDESLDVVSARRVPKDEVIQTLAEQLPIEKRVMLIISTSGDENAT